MDTITKKGSAKIQEILKNAGKRVGFETGELNKTAQKQVLGNPDEKTGKLPDGNKISPIAEAMQQTTNSILTEEDKDKIQAQFMDRTRNLEEEMKKYRKIREEKEKTMNQENSSSNIVGPGEPMFKPLEVPISKHSRGKLPGMPGTARGETGPEVRKSKQ
jgi:hypothetical protein